MTNTTQPEQVGAVREDGTTVTQADVDYAAVLEEVAAVVGVKLAERLDDAVMGRIHEAHTWAVQYEGAVIQATLDAVEAQLVTPETSHA